MRCNNTVSLPLLSSFLVLSLAARADEAPSLAGAWEEQDRHSVVRFEKGPDNVWTGTFVRSPNPKEVGQTAFERLEYDAKGKAFRGTLIKPEDGERHNITVEVKNANTLHAVARKFIFSKTIVFLRQSTGDRPQAPAVTK
jgi:uncharacterized protein (DUF2147 family)